MRVKHTFLFTLFLGLGWAGFLFAYSGGPDPGTNGIFGATNTCSTSGCHTGNVVNAAGGTLSLSGLPAEWIPGQTYPLTIFISKAGAETYGFQLSAVSDSTSRQAGTLSKGKTTGTDASRISITGLLGGVNYAQHNTVNSQLAPTTTFFVDWTAPASSSAGTVRFNLAGNAANGNSWYTGDFIYARTDRISPGSVPAPDFSIALWVGSNSVTAGTSGIITVGAPGVNGFTGSVGLSVSGLPAGATASFNPTSIAAGANSTMTITATAGAVPGTYPLTITGLSGSISHASLFSLTIVAAPGESVRAFTVANFGGSSSSTDGTGVLGVGYARIQAGAGSTTPAGVEIIGFRSNNVLVGETGVPASPLITAGRIYAEVNGPVNTGLAIANPNSQTATISFFFTDVNGVDTATRQTTIPANQQLARFLNEAPYSGGSLIQGTFSFTSDVPVSVVALRGFTNEVRNDFLISTLPVINTSVAGGTGTQVLPHFANGGGWTTQVILVNPGSTTLTGSLQFISAGGAPVTLTVNGQSTSGPAYSVAPRSSQKLVTSGSVVAGGSVRVVPTAGGAAPTPLVVFSFKPQTVTLTEAGAPANGGTAFRMYVESLGISGQPGNIQSGIAVANGTSTAATVTFELFNLNGTTTGLTKAQALPASGQYAAFLAEIFPTVPQPFQGVLRISSPSSVSVVGLRGRYNERTEFLITTTPPTLESTPASAAEQLFPHLVNGGGYTTQFILFSGGAGQTSTGSLRFFQTTGTPLTLILNR